MGLRYDNREWPPELPSTREPLVDIDVTAPQPNQPQPASAPRRRRLSDMETENVQSPLPSPAKPTRRSRVVAETDPGQPASGVPPVPEPRRTGLVDIAPASPEQDEMPRAGRARGAITHPCDGVPGLQSILHPARVDREMPVPGQDNEAAEPQSSTDSVRIAQLLAELRARQNFPRAAVGGLAAAVIGALVWAFVTVATNYQIGWMAVGVGFLVGGGVRTLGRGIDRSFGYLGATLAVCGCLLGNILSLCAVVAGQGGGSAPAVLAHVCRHPVLLPAALIATFHPMDLLFYGIAIYEGYRFSFRHVTDTEIGPGVSRDEPIPNVCPAAEPAGFRKR